MREIIYVAALTSEIYGLIRSIIAAQKFGDEELPKKLKRKIRWSIFGIIILALGLFGGI